MVAQSADEGGDGRDEVAHRGGLGGEDVQLAGVVDVGLGEDVELELLNDFRVGVGDGHGEVDDGVDDGLG